MLNYNYNETNKTGLTVILIHGLGGNLKTFIKIIEGLPDFVNTLCVDLNGHGKSEDMLCNNLRSFEYVCIEIKKILDRENIEKATFIGFSLGTMVVSSFAFLFPEYINNIIMLGDVTHISRTSKVLSKIGYSTKIFRNFKLTYTVLAHSLMPYKKHALSRKYTIKEALKMKNKEYFSWSKLTHDFWDYFPIEKIQCQFKTLFISGKNDIVFLKPLLKSLEQTNEEMYKLEIIEDAGHVVHLDQPVLVNNSINEFLCPTIQNSRAISEIAIGKANMENKINIHV